MKPDEIKSLVEKLSGQKSMIRDLDDLPKDTKPKKLPRPVQKGLEEHFGIKLSRKPQKPAKS